MTDTDKYEGHTCKWCGYVEDAGAWHYEECPIFDDPMMKHHIAEVKRLREQVSKAKEWVRSYFINMSGDFNSLEDKVVYDDFMQQMGMKKND